MACTNDQCAAAAQKWPSPKECDCDPCTCTEEDPCPCCVAAPE